MKLTILFAAASAIRMRDDVSSTMDSLAEAEKELGSKLNKVPLTAEQERKAAHHGYTNYMTVDYKTFLREDAAEAKEQADTIKEAENEVK